MVKARWAGNIKKWYVNKGYICTKMNDYFDCDIKDLMPTSPIKVKVICDYCGKIFDKSYRDYFKSRVVIQKDCCKDYKCSHKKQEEVMMVKYGVKNHMQLKKSQENLRNIYKTDFNIIKELCDTKGLILLSNEKDYSNDRSRLNVICSHHREEGIQETCFANIKKNKGCCGFEKYDLIADSERLDGNIVYQAFIDEGFEPQFKPENYEKNNIALPYICPLHRDKGLQYREYANLKVSTGCYFCAKERTGKFLKFDDVYIDDYLSSRNLILAEGEKYTNKETHFNWICNKHPDKIQNSTLSNMKATKEPCIYCRIENSLTKLSRNIRHWLNKWKKDSEEFCNYKCILTEDVNYEIHHLYSLNTIIKEALDELNIESKEEYNGEEFMLIKDKVLELHDKYGLGVCLTKKCHILFHQLYSKGNNTPEQFEEFKQRYYNHEFDDILDNNIISKVV